MCSLACACVPQAIGSDIASACPNEDDPTSESALQGASSGIVHVCVATRPGARNPVIATVNLLINALGPNPDLPDTQSVLSAAAAASTPGPGLCTGPSLVSASSTAPAPPGGSSAVSGPDKTADGTGLAPASSAAPAKNTRISLGPKPVNEFANNPELMEGAFPDVFGAGLDSDTLGGRNGTVPGRVTRQWMLFYDGRFQRCRKLVFLLFNQLTRHAAASSTCARINRQDNRLVELINAKGFDQWMAAAKADPSGHEARRLLRVFLPYVRIVGAKIPWSPTERSGSISYLYAQARLMSSIINSHI